MMKARFAAIQVALKKLAARRPPRARPINNLHNFLEKRGEVWPNAALEKLLKKHDFLKVKMFEFSRQNVALKQILCSLFKRHFHFVPKRIFFDSSFLFKLFFVAVFSLLATIHNAC